MRSKLSRIAVASLFGLAAAQVYGQDQADLVYQVQELREEIRQLRGLVEMQQRELENVQRRQRDQYLDLDQRLRARAGAQVNDRPPGDGGLQTAPVEPVVEAPQNQAPITAPVASIAQAPEVRDPIDSEREVATLSSPPIAPVRELEQPTESEQTLYDRAFADLRDARYAAAAEGFAEFLRAYPDSELAPNAQYWMAEGYYVTRDFPTALGLFEQLLESYPDSSKRADALLKIGFSHFEMRQWNQARAALEQVRSEHPNTTLARLAEGRLRDMRMAGHF